MIKHYIKIGYIFIKDIHIINNKSMYMYNIQDKQNFSYLQMLIILQHKNLEFIFYQIDGIKDLMVIQKVGILMQVQDHIKKINIILVKVMILNLVFHIINQHNQKIGNLMMFIHVVLHNKMLVKMQKLKMIYNQMVQQNMVMVCGLDFHGIHQLK